MRLTGINVPEDSHLASGLASMFPRVEIDGGCMGKGPDVSEVVLAKASASEGANVAPALRPDL